MSKDPGTAELLIWYDVTHSRPSARPCKLAPRLHCIPCRRKWAWLHIEENGVVTVLLLCPAPCFAVAVMAHVELSRQRVVVSHAATPTFEATAFVQRGR